MLATLATARFHRVSVSERLVPLLSHPPVMVETMNDQLRLLQPDEPPWRLDEHTRQVGRQGLRQARAALHRTVADPAEPAAARPRPRPRPSAEAA